MACVRIHSNNNQTAAIILELQEGKRFTFCRSLVLSAAQAHDPRYSIAFDLNIFVIAFVHKSPCEALFSNHAAKSRIKIFKCTSFSISFSDSILITHAGPSISIAASAPLSQSHAHLERSCRSRHIFAITAQYVVLHCFANSDYLQMQSFEQHCHAKCISS